MKNPLPKNAGSVQTLHRQAVKCLQRGQFDEGIRLLKQALELFPASGDLHNDLGTAYWQKGEPEQAESHYGKAAKLAPKSAQVLNNYGAFILEQGQIHEAEKYLRRAVKESPSHFEALNNLGLSLYRQGKMEEAEACLRESIKSNNRWANSWANLGRILAETGRPADAEVALRQALKINPRHADAWLFLGCLFISVTKQAEAVDCFRRALSYNPHNKTAWVRLASTLEFLNLIDDSLKAIEESRKTIGTDPLLSLIEAKIARRRKDYDGAEKILENILPGLKEESPRNFPVFYELGQLYDRRNECDKAFEFFTKGNHSQSLSPEAQGIDKNAMPDIIKKYRATFTPEWIESWTPAPSWPDKPQLVFLVGFPRSGTTLLDQILSSHPDVAVAEEKPATDALINRLHSGGKDAYPRLLADLSSDSIDDLRRFFLNEHHTAGADLKKKILVDKLPLNLTHTGLLHRIFPDARFILALRHPCDSVLSCFMQQFTLNNAMIHFLDLKDTAQTYDRVFGLWEHYRSVLPLNVHEIKYEDVVADFRPAVEGLLKFLDVPWTDAVLEYDKTARERKAINTPSYSQVTEKIYTRAAGRWARYREHMRPVLDTLRPWAEKHGYDV